MQDERKGSRDPSEARPSDARPSERQKDLRDEIRWLGEVLGEVLREQAGEEAFQRVEAIRSLSRARRQGDPDGERRLVDLLQALDSTDFEPLITSLSVFFDLANLAEDRERVRVVRERERVRATRESERAGTLSDSDSEDLATSIRVLRDGGMKAGEVQALLRQTGIEFVFTAHPTEAKRRSVREKIRDLRSHLYALDDPLLLPHEHERIRRLVKADLTGLWQTEFIRFRRPSVLEELDRSLFFAGNLWRVVPQLFRELESALREAFPGDEFEIPAILRFGTWIGGDRDGNPYVTADVTRRALTRLRAEVFDRHIDQARLARRTLSMSSRKKPVSRELEGALESALDRWPELKSEVEHLSGSEPYRRWLRIVQWRLERAAAADPLDHLPEGAYPTPVGLLQDLQIARRSLAENGGLLLAEAHLDDWIRQTQVFGFSMMRLDVRQESSWYERVMGELLDALLIGGDYSELNEDERQRMLTDSMPCTVAPDEATLSEDAREALALFRLLASVYRVSGSAGLGPHVVSMTRRPSDVLTVLWLARWAAADVGLPDGHFPLAIAPLFETIQDLRRAPETLDALLSHPEYREHVRELGDRQVVMVGYSDSTKDGGYLAASWSLYDSQFRMQGPAQAHGVDLVFFHGRGGALGRGGGPAARHIRSLPPRTLRAGVRITEQGEVLSERYDDPWIARRHLQQMLSAVLRCAGQSPHRASLEEEWVPSVPRDLLGPLAERSREAYRELVDLPGFIRYFEEATPISQIEELAIGSRPSRRRADRSLDNLRAIPWVFSWNQSRHLLPAWYGLGTALKPALTDPQARDALRELYLTSGFFRATIDNAALALAKADMGIARVHAALVEDPELRASVLDRVTAEHERARLAVLDLTGNEGLLDEIPWLKRSIEVRNPYVDPLNLIQVELFRRFRALPEDTARRDHHGELIRMTIQGIAGGLRTTG